MIHRDGLRPRLLGRFAVLLFLLPLLVLTSVMSGFAQSPAPAPPAGSPSIEVWRGGMARVRPPNRGCFTSSYPNTQWQEAPCVAAPRIPFPPARGPRPSTAGGGNDPIAGVTTGNISTAVGSFDSVSGVTSVTGAFGSNDYSLQLNANVFTTPICSGGGTPAQCVGWQQFIFSAQGCGEPCTFMQYWLIGWGSTTCPSGWTFFNNSGDDECYANSDAVVPPQQALSNLGNLSVVAEAASDGLDSVIFSTGSNLYLVQNNDSMLDLAQGWTAFEYNIVGDGNGSAAVFNAGASIVVRMGVDYGLSSAPSCVSASFEGYTAETNNLYFVAASGTPQTETRPAIVFTENSTISSTLPCASTTGVAAASKLVDTHDFNGDGRSDIAWRNTNGDVAIWLMNGTQILSSPDIANVPNSWTIVGQRDFNGDGYYDILWRNSNGDVSIWFMSGTQIFSSPDFVNVPNSWTIVGTSDFNGDGKGDILWRNTNGDVAIWLMNGTQILSSPDLGNVPISWTIVGTGDFNGDGKSDILWRNANGDVGIWFMNGTQVSSAPDFVNVPNSWSIVGTGDFNGDGMSDILWRNSNGDVSIWLMNGTQISSSPDLGNVPNSWVITETGDFNGDGKADILWRNANGDVSIWFMNGTQISSTPDFVNVPNSWKVQSANAN